MLAQPKPIRRMKVPRPLKRTADLGAKRRDAKASGTLTPEEWQRICAWSRWRCSYCQGPSIERIQQDHVVSIAKGGKHEAANLALACPACNYRKGTGRMAFHHSLPAHPFRGKP